MGKGALVAYGLAGLLLAGALVLLPTGREWQREDAIFLKEAALLGERVAAVTFPAWKPAETPYLILKGRVNYLVDFPGGPAGQEVADPDFVVRRLDRPLIPFLVAGPYELEDTPLAMLPSKPALDRTLEGLQEAGNLGTGGEGDLVRGLLKLHTGTRLTPEQYVTVALHESFHAYQWPVLIQWAARLPADIHLFDQMYSDPQNNRWQDEEGRLLYEAVIAPDVQEARRLLGRFQAVRAERRAYWEGRLGGAEARGLLEWEAFYEWIEGLARYIEIRSWEMGARPDYEPVRGLASEPLFHAYRDTAGAGRQVLIDQIGQPVSGEGGRERVYRLGAGQALLLDRLLPGWQAEAARGVDLFTLLRQAGETGTQKSE